MSSLAFQAISLGAIAYGRLAMLPRRGKIGAVEIDATIEENHRTQNQITDHEVEDGADVTDHVRFKPEAITMVGQVSNTPLERSLGFTDTTGIGGGLRLTSPDAERAETAYGDLLFLQVNAIPCTIVTSLNVYEDMIIESLDVPRNAKLGNVLRFTAQLRAIRKVRSETVVAPATDVQSAKPQVSKGKQAPTPAPEQSRSFLYNLRHGS